MRKLTLVVALSFAASIVFAQNSNVRKAESALESGELAEAKTLIEEAVKHEKTFDDGKTWYVRGTIYNALVNKEFDAENLKAAANSFKKVMELEKEGSSYYTLADLKVQEIWGKYINQGSDAYTNQKFEEAVTNFKRAMLVLPEDTTATLYAGISSQQAGDNLGALEYYYRLIDLDYHSADVYGSIISIERYQNKDLDKALEVTGMAIKQFPEDDAFAKQEINLLISAERTDEAKNRLMAAIQKEPENANLYFNLGYLYEELEQPEKAKEAYLKAIEIDPEYFEANYNYAVYNYNLAADLYDKSRNMDLKTYQKEGKKVEQKAADYLKTALPYFEKSKELRPNDLAVLETLQIVYSQLKMNDKAMETMDKIEELEAQQKAGEGK